MTVITTRTFKSGNSEALRLPKELAYGIGTELTLERSGEVLTIRPKTKAPHSPTWRQDLRAMLDALEALPKPSSIQKRAKIEQPYRKGL